MAGHSFSTIPQPVPEVNTAYRVIRTAIPAPGTAEFRAALRDALEATQGLATTNGVVNMSKSDHLGLDQRARVMVQIKGGKWVYQTE